MKLNQAVAHIVASMSNPAAGPTYSVRRLADSTSVEGFDAAILSVDNTATADQNTLSASTFSQDRLTFPFIKEMYFSKDLRREIANQAKRGAILHAHGLWLMPNVYPSWSAKRFNVPLIHAPRGMLGAGALKFSARKKRIFSTLFQRRALECVTCFHATSLQEYDDIRRYGLDGPVAIVPNGIDLPNLAVRERIKTTERRSLLYLGRVHPKKGIDRLLAAWSTIEPEYEDWDLKIVGPSEDGHRQMLLELSERLGLKRVEFQPGLFGLAKEQAFRAADLFVLPTLDENFGIVVAEALANGTPVITTRGAPWSGLEKHRCGWWIEHHQEALVASLREAMEMPRGMLDEMGLRGRDWMRRDFSWDRVAAEMSMVYRWCLGRASIPPNVILD